MTAKELLVLSIGTLILIAVMEWAHAGELTEGDVDAVLSIVNDRAAAINFVAYCVAALFGQLACAARLWLAKEIDCVFDRFRRDPRATLNAVITNFSAVGVFGFTIPWAQMPLQHVLGIGVLIPVASILMGLSQGYSADSALNKSQRKVWTDEERKNAAPPA